MGWGILAPIAKLGTTYMEGKQQIAKAKTKATMVGLKADAEIKVAKATAAAKLAENGQTQDHNLDMVAMRQMEKSYMDEFMILILLVPILLAFFPSWQPQIQAGFDAFKQMPDWYQYLVIGVFIVKFGMRGMLNKLLASRPSFSFPSKKKADF